jgi:hypothetical protein
VWQPKRRYDRTSGLHRRKKATSSNIFRQPRYHLTSPQPRIPP